MVVALMALAAALRASSLSGPVEKIWIQTAAMEAMILMVMTLTPKTEASVVRNWSAVKQSAAWAGASVAETHRQQAVSKLYQSVNSERGLLYHWFS